MRAQYLVSSPAITANSIIPSRLQPTLRGPSSLVTIRGPHDAAQLRPRLEARLIVADPAVTALPSLPALLSSVPHANLNTVQKNGVHGASPNLAIITHKIPPTQQIIHPAPEAVELILPDSDPSHYSLAYPTPLTPARMRRVLALMDVLIMDGFPSFV